MEQESRWKYYNHFIGAIEVTRPNISTNTLQFKLIYQGYIDFSRSYVVHLATNLILKYYVGRDRVIETTVSSTKSRQMS